MPYRFKPSTYKKKIEDILQKSGVKDSGEYNKLIQDILKSKGADDGGNEPPPDEPKLSEEEEARNQFDFILRTIRKDKDYPRNQTKSAVNWFRNKIQELGSVTEYDVMSDESRTVKSPRDFIGKMFFFQYSDPKYKKKLPYWDAFPLIFPIDMKDDTFLGLNMHYLDYNLRFAFFNKLLEFATNPKLNSKTKLQTTYGLLKSAANMKEYIPTIHKYLWNRVDSHFIRVSAPDWATSLFLPIADFRKKSESYVWKDSKRKMK